jgi:protein-S-isoprenylcysteine O-methyltransferase Ste14
MSNRPEAELAPSTVRHRGALPASCTSTAITLAGVLGFGVALILCRLAPGIEPINAAMLCIAAIALPIAVLEIVFLKTYRRPSTGLDGSPPRALDSGRLAVKLIGFYGTLAVIALIYWLIPKHEEDPFAPSWRALTLVLPFLVIGAVPYFAFVDRLMREPEDGYWQAGCLFLGRWSEVDRAVLRQYALGWLVKAFFLPLMFLGLVKYAKFLLEFGASEPAHGLSSLYLLGVFGIYGIDVAYACVGYIFTLRIFDSHIRTTDSRLSGWLPTIICYPVYWTPLLAFEYWKNDEIGWIQAFDGYPLLQVLWGVTIIALTAFYAWSTVIFGLRFSNLTHRGVLTNGPYRFTKHPAYVSKNLGWWLILVPTFAVSEPHVSLLNATILLSFNVIYYLRAWTEERHLSWDPNYRAYAMAMNYRSVFRFVGRMIPIFRYRPPADYRLRGGP